MCLSSPKAPDPQPTAPPPIQAQDAAAKQMADEERRLRARQQGFESTILTSPLGTSGKQTKGVDSYLGG